MIKSVYLLVEESIDPSSGFGNEELLDVFLNEDLAISWARYMTKSFPSRSFSLRQRGVQMLTPEKAPLEVL